MELPGTHNGVSVNLDFRKTLVPDADPLETREWLDSIDSVLQYSGHERAHHLLRQIHEHLQVDGIRLPYLVHSPYINTIPAADQPIYPGDLAMEKRIRRIVRWNAAVMVHRANQRHPGLGGHLATYASAATMYEVGFHHFFRSPEHPGGGDQVFFQGHSAPGVYAHAFLAGRLSDAQLDGFRREAGANPGMSSYPHPRLMPDFWQFSTVSMGLGPMCAVYQARFNRYLQHRGIRDTSNSRVWAFLGDGETDEPESLGAISLAAREGLDNLTFVVNCNLQRLDGPVRGNGKIIQELESVFLGAGWNVIKVLWGSSWDPLLAKDHEGVLRKRFAEVVDGEYQKYVTSDLSYVREHFFGKYPQLRAMAAELSDVHLRRMYRGGHDAPKVYAAYDAATKCVGKPTVILCKTVKGYTLGDGIEARNYAHQQKKFGGLDLERFRDLLQLPIADKELADPPFYHPGADSPEVAYLLEHRAALGGPMPMRLQAKVQVQVPGDDVFARFLAGSGTTEVSTTGAFVSLLTALLRDRDLGKRLVPILCDEGRTFGMESLFKPYGIYSSLGQLYTPVDADFVLAYREARDGQILQEGINEAGSVASFIAAGTSYSTHGEPMIPMYFFYSMFGFQRTADLIWQAADMNARGFLLGCTAGRTTLNGEGLQHQDGHSHILASTNPAVVPFEPTWAYEVATIARDGLRRMLGGEDVIYYLTLQNEPYTMPVLPKGAEQGILRGLYLARAPEVVIAVGDAPALPDDAPEVQLIGGGSIMAGVLEAQRRLMAEHGVRAAVWSATSYTLLRREAQAQDDAARRQRLAPADRQPSWLDRTLGATAGPIISASDWMKLTADQIAPWLNGRLTSLGTDGFGMSDTRTALRRHFEVDADAIVDAALWRLGR